MAISSKKVDTPITPLYCTVGFSPSVYDKIVNLKNALRTYSRRASIGLIVSTAVEVALEDETLIDRIITRLKKK